MTATRPKLIRHVLFRNCSLCPSQTAGGEAARLQVKSMRNNISWLELDLRQPKDRLTLLARVVGRLIPTADPARLDHVIFALLGSAPRLDAFLSYDSTDDRGLQLVAYGGIPEADIAGVGRLEHCPEQIGNGARR